MKEIIETLDKDAPLRWKAITYLLIDTGCRRGEIMGLKWLVVIILCLLMAMITVKSLKNQCTKQTFSFKNFSFLLYKGIELFGQQH